jgi:hypothetical protein
MCVFAVRLEKRAWVVDVHVLIWWSWSRWTLDLSATKFCLIVRLRTRFGGVAPLHSRYKILQNGT